MNKTENRKDEFDLALENMKLEPEADLDRLIEKRVKQMMTRSHSVCREYSGSGLFGLRFRHQRSMAGHW